jgi:hypothetical protein
VTPKEIKERVQKIKDAANSGDDEAAHEMEKTLQHDFIEFASFCQNIDLARECAVEILKIGEIDFSRWFA